MFRLFFRICRKVVRLAQLVWDNARTLAVFHGGEVIFGQFHTNGCPYVDVWNGGRIIIGSGFAMNNRISGNPIGVYSRCTFIASDGATLRIGDNVGISQSAIVAKADITIGDNVKIGGGSVIYSTDFHSLSPEDRNSDRDAELANSAPVVIDDNVFIGAHCIVLKGVTIGRNSVIGAGSVVTRSIPDNVIAAGNPCRVIREIKTHEE